MLTGGCGLAAAFATSSAFVGPEDVVRRCSIRSFWGRVELGPLLRCRCRGWSLSSFPSEVSSSLVHSDPVREIPGSMSTAQPPLDWN